MRACVCVFVLSPNQTSMWKQWLSKLPRGKTAEEADDGASGSNSNNGSDEPLVPRNGKSNDPQGMVAEPLVAFKDVPMEEKQNLFLSKMELCCVVFDFHDSCNRSLEKDIKRQALVELIDYISGVESKFGEAEIRASGEMFAINLFRTLPPNGRWTGGTWGVREYDDDEPVFDIAWSHLQLVYELMLKLISSSSFDAKVAKKYLDQSFVSRFLDLFESCDPRERDCLKAILHRIYSKFMVHRAFIRKSVSNIFYRFVFETGRHNGIAELLEVLGSIIGGFAIPLREEHKRFLWRALIPLHKPKSIAVYFHQLTFCISQFIDKEPKLVGTVVRGLLKYWPVTNSSKEVMFLSELEEVLESTYMAEFQKIMVPVFRRIACCLNSTHFQVAERALFLWNNDHVAGMVAQNRHVIVPIIFPALERNSNHWNQAVLNVTRDVRKMFSDMDEEFYLECRKRFEEEEEQRISTEEKRRLTWERLESQDSAVALQPHKGNNSPALLTPISPPLIAANLS